MRLNFLTRWSSPKQPPSSRGFPEHPYYSYVQDGAEFLDRVHPGWADEVDPKWLNQGSCIDCVLGQLYHEYSLGCDLFMFTQGGRRAVEYGFFAPMNNPTIYAQLTALWKLEIYNRREPEGMDIGKESPAIVVEPIEDPFEAPREDPAPAPVKAPSKEKEAVPA